MLRFISDPSPAGDYFATKAPKDAIVLHFTAGYTIHSANTTLDKIDQMAVAYIVDLNGDVYHKFDKEFWAYHLGVKASDGNTNHQLDKRTIGIEIVNIGPVWLKNGKWYDYVGREWKEEEVVRGNDRGANGGAKFSIAQVDAVCELVNALLVKMPSIPRQVPKDKIPYQLPALLNFQGVMTHQMLRKDKWDLGVGFDKECWDKLISECGLVEV